MSNISDLSQLLQVPEASLETPDDFFAINELYLEKGWGDGLPLIPPTEARVAAMLEYCDRPWDVPVGKVAPRYGEATPLRLAANAVMAGCKPEYFPLIVLAVEAMCDDAFNLYGIQATTHMCAPLLIVNGPAALELGMNSGHNAFGPGTHSNATIGRAIRLILLNIGGAIPALGDMSTFGSPSKYSYCVAENEARNPWQPLHVERGFPKEASCVTVVGAECPHNVNDHESISGLGIMKTIAGTLISTGMNDVYYPDAMPLIVIGPEHAATIANDGISKQAVKQFITEHATLPLGAFSTENIERRFRVAFASVYKNADKDAPVPMVHNADNLVIAVIGGAGKHSAIVPTFGATRVVTRALKRKDGQYARNMHEMRKA
jgi:hypothetical protein